MKLVFTGETRLPREELADRCTRAGLEVLNSLSRLTSVLVTNERRSISRKAERARVEATPIIDEALLLRLLADVRPGQAKERQTATRAARVPAEQVSGAAMPTPSAPGPMARRRVLIVGGSHTQAAAIRAEVVARGGSAAVNYSAKVTDLVVLSGGDADPRVARARAAGVHIHAGPISLGIELPDLSAPIDQAAAPAAVCIPAPAAVPAVEVVPPELTAASSPVLPRGGVIDMPDGLVWTVNAAWRADALASGVDVDVVAFLLDDQQRTTVDEDFVFYNAPVSEDGAVALSVDGDSEQSIRIDLSLLPDYCNRVAVVAALTGEATFGELGAIELSIDGEQTTLFTATLDAGTTETTMVLAELYLRNDQWRARAVGQGYDSGLAELCEQYGVDVTG
jgi:DNA polymerase-3 subunit epsilon